MVEDPFAETADDFIGHYDTVRGIVRHELVSAQVDRHLPSASTTVIDVGGGAGHQALRLANRGYHVTLVDPSRRMLDEAEKSLRAEDPAVRSRVRIVHAAGEDSPAVLEGDQFGVVCCHAVLPYAEDPAGLLGALGDLAEPGAVLSLLFKNADALAMRPALERRWTDAMAAFDSDEDVGGLGIPTVAHRLDDVRGWLVDAGFSVETWYGIRVFCDHLEDPPAGEIDDIVRVEAEASHRDPYRSLGRLIHAIAKANE